MELKAVIFDMDGVLTATDEFHYQSWKRAIQEIGLPFHRADNEKLLGLTRRRSLEVILGDRQLPEKQMQEILQRKNRYYLEAVAKMSAGDLLPGIDRLLGELTTARIRIGVASASRNAQSILGQLGVDRYMDAIVDGNTIQRSKPAPDVYLRTAQLLDVDPRSCLALEDSLAGVSAAIQAGMCVIGIGPVERVGKANAVLPNLAGTTLADLRRIFDRWAARSPSIGVTENPRS